MMTMRDTLLDVIVLCMMAKMGEAEGDDVIDRILERTKPFCEEGLQRIISSDFSEKRKP